MLDSISYYTNSDPLTLENSAKLRYICTYGPTTTITYPENGSWNWVSLVVRDAPTEEMGGVSGGCRWEGDSLVFRVTNNSRTALDNGVILTDYGFVTVGDLLPVRRPKRPLRPCLPPRPARLGTAMKPLAMVCC